MPRQNYRNYIKNQISKENEEEKKSDNDIVREEIEGWIKRKNLNLDKRTIRDILVTCSRLITYPKIDIENEKIKLECFLTYTKVQNMNIVGHEILKDLKKFENYVKEIYLLIRIRLDVESRYNHKSLRIRQIDALDLVSLFDNILKHIKDKKAKTEIEKLMNKYVYEGLYSYNEYI